MTEREIIDGVVAGDRRYCSMLVQQYQDMVYSVALNVLHDQSLAKDVSQEVFVKVYRNISGFEGDAKLMTWIYRIAYNESITYYRKRKRKEGKHTSLDQIHGIATNAHDAYELIDQQERKQRVGETLDQLGGDDKILLDLFYLKELTIKEIGEIMNLTQSNVKVKLHRARKKFENKWSA